MFLADVARLPGVSQTTRLARPRASTLVRADRASQVEPVEWVELANVSTTDRVTASLARVEELRREIASDTYITDDKLDIVVGKLIDILHTPR